VADTAVFPESKGSMLKWQKNTEKTPGFGEVFLICSEGRS